MSSIQESSIVLPDPTFTPEDIANITPINLKTVAGDVTGTLPQFTNSDTLRYVLYSEPNWDIFIHDKIVTAGFTQYKTGSYDGYCLYWLVKFANLPYD